MSSLGGSTSSGNRSRSAATVCWVSSTDSVVCDNQATLAGSRTCVLALSSGPSTRWMCSGASPVVPTTSSCPSCPMSREHDHRALRHLLGFLHEHRATGFQGRNHVGVVHDLLTHVDRCAVQLEGYLNRLHGPVHPRAVPAGLGEQYAP